MNESLSRSDPEVIFADQYPMILPSFREGGWPACCVRGHGKKIIREPLRLLWIAVEELNDHKEVTAP